MNSETMSIMFQTTSSTTAACQNLPNCQALIDWESSFKTFINSNYKDIVSDLTSFNIVCQDLLTCTFGSQLLKPDNCETNNVNCST